MSDAAVITPKYEKGSSGPSSFVLKYAKSTEQGRAAATAANMYEKEISFYLQMREQIHPVVRKRVGVKPRGA